MPGRIARLRFLMLAVGLLLLAACSRLDLAYRNLDLLIPWWIGTYVSLDDEQKAWLEPRLDQHLAWHCDTQLPEYVAWLEQLGQLSQRPQVSANDLRGQLVQVREAAQNIAVQITPTALGLAESLTPKQMGELYVAMDERNAELREKHVAPSRKQQAAARTLRMRESVEEWMGPLRPSQVAHIDAWAKARGDYNKTWAENRENWQKALRSTLYDRHNADFRARLTALLQEPEDFWTEAYRKAYPASEAALAQLFADLLNSADEGQRSTLRQRIGDLSSDLKGLACYPR